MSKKFRTSVPISEEDQTLAESIAEGDERSLSFVYEKALHNGLPTLDSEKAKSIRVKKAGKAKK